MAYVNEGSHSLPATDMFIHSWNKGVFLHVGCVSC